MVEVSRRVFYRATVLKDMKIGNDLLDKGVVLESETAPDSHWEYGEARIPVKYLQIQKFADITFQTLVTISME